MVITGRSAMRAADPRSSSTWSSSSAQASRLISVQRQFSKESR